MPNLSYSVADFQPFTLIRSAEVNAKFNDIKTLLNVTKLDSTNVQLNGLTRDRLALGTINHVVINSGTGALSSEAQLAISRGGTGQAFTLTGMAGSAIVVDPTETFFELGIPSVDKLVEQFAAEVPTLVAGEAIANRDAVCLDLAKDSSNNDIYMVFNADSSLPNRRNNFIGFSNAAYTVTQGTWTWVADANFVASNVITFSINGRGYSVPFTTSNALTLAAVAVAMAGDPDISGAVSDGVHTITVTGTGAKYINVTGSLVTGGGSQANIVYTNTLLPHGDSVSMTSFGPMTGFSGLSTTKFYYLDATPGGITNNPLDSNPLLLGQALSPTVLLVNFGTLNSVLSTPGLFIRSHGCSTGTTVSGAQLNAEHYNFASWAAGTSSPQKLMAVAAGEQQYGGYHYVLEGLDAASAVSSYFARYNKSSWSNQPNTRADNRYAGASCGVFNNFYYAGKGEAGGGGTTGRLDQWNGSAWTGSVGTLANAGSGMNAVSQGNMLHWAGGQTGGSPYNAHDTFDGSSVSTATAYPANSFTGIGMRDGSNAIFGGTGGYSTVSYSWDGASWSSSIPLAFGVTDGSGGGLTATCPANAFNSSGGISFANGGTSSAAVSRTASQQFNGSAWASSVASSSARSGGAGSII